MKATEAKFLEFIKKSPQFVIPIYQRTYSWTERECQQLWKDILRTGENDAVTAHFVGSIVYIEKGLYQVTSQTPLLVIDGQQRLTTLSLLVAALAEALDALPDGEREPVDGFSPRKLRNYYLINPEEEGERHYKLILSQTDRDSLIALVAGKELPKEYSRRVLENYEFFKTWIASQKGNLTALCKGIAKLIVVDIALSRDQDNPQLIFESMNSTGRELTQADLIRNYILMGLEPELQTRLYQDYWRPMELEFGQESYGDHFDAFMRYYLTVKTGTGDIPKLGAVYESFKNHAQMPEVAKSGVEALVADIRDYSRYFCAMALGAEPDSELQRAFHDLREMKANVTYPFLLELYDDYAKGILARSDFLTAVRLIESYVFRRAICGIPTNSLNKTFATFAKALKKDRYLESIQAHFLLMPSYRGFPGDEVFKRELCTRDLYNFPRRSYWLRRLENHGRKERVEVDEYTIEHIMPQNEKLSRAWREALGPEWKSVHETYLHTLGNLTLTGYNSEYSDRSFPEKRDMAGGFKESPLHLNQGLGTCETWNEEEIKKRAKRLSKTAVTVWHMPTLDPEILEAYQPKKEASTGYTLESHPHLIQGKSKDLFEALREEVLSLDPAVSEEILKLYVAYKAETNFVDVVPQAKRLRLSLNMAFADIYDPRGLCKDVTNVGRWGNGDVEVGFSSLEELPYVMGLIRQAFERQMGNGDES
ncbi:MAG: DUF262 domain-containing protein [Candidatus Hydrogenedentes bacterium]|nr:DUF262 domain-containing protein [Candidatus Hydrogenedentota bacterium]